MIAASRKWLRLHLSADGAPFRRLRKEEQAGVLDLSGPAGVDRRRRAVQLNPHYAHHPRALRLRVHGRQRGHLRHLQKESRRGETLVHEPQQNHLAGEEFF